MSPFEQSLYESDSIPTALQGYAELLQQSGDNKSLLHATKILEYKNIINSKSNSTLRKIFDNFYNILSKEFPNLRFRISGRRKSYVSIEQKIQRNLKLNKSLDLIRDMLGVRIILLNGKPKDCYLVLERLISVCLADGFTICEENSHNTDKNSLNSKSRILSQFYYGITDYIASPKENGYQSLHATFRNSTGFCFEVQVRTFDMHVNADCGSSGHSTYKKAKYDSLEFNRCKIKIPGYSITPSGSIIDLIGLELALEVIQRNKSY